jgi:hypothetical protein
MSHTQANQIKATITFQKADFQQEIFLTTEKGKNFEASKTEA